MPPQHKLNLRIEQGRIVLVCSRGDRPKDLGPEPTPSEVAQAADAHWGKPLGWL